MSTLQRCSLLIVITAATQMHTQHLTAEKPNKLAGSERFMLGID